MAASQFLPFVLFLLIAPLAAQSDYPPPPNDSQVFDVVDYGAVGDGITDDSQAFNEAWRATCNSSSSHPTMLIPYGKTYFLHEIFFRGPCKSNNVSVKILGNLVAPSELSEWSCHPNQNQPHNCGPWIAFFEVDGLFITGEAADVTIDGRGSKWWKLRCHVHHTNCGRLPTMLAIAHSNNVHISGIKFLNSPNTHVLLESSTWIYISNVTISALKSSPNTDGIHLQQSKNVSIQYSRIGTGDDCVSMGDGSAYISINNIACGPGHGISIGSLGKKGSIDKVENIHVSDVEFTGATNGVRIKTWEGGKGSVKNIVFERIWTHGSDNPIIIDQHYCNPHDPHSCDTTKNSTAVEISNVIYRDVYGTSNKRIAVKFACSETTPCTNILIGNVSIPSTRSGRHTSSYCHNVQGIAQGEVVPKVPCLYHLD